MRLVANDLMRKAHRSLKKAGPLDRFISIKGPPPVKRRFGGRGRTKPTHREILIASEGDPDGIGLAPTAVLEPTLREAIGDGINTLIDKVERVVTRRHALEKQTPAPRPHVLANPGDPTEQWTAKHQGQIAKHVVSRGEIMPVKSHRVKSPIEQVERRLGAAEYLALEAFFKDAVVAMSGGTRTANWQASGGGGGDRLGGLGNVTQEYRDRLARNQWVEARLSPKMLETAQALVTHELCKPNGARFSLEEWGKHLAPSVIDRNRLWGVSFGALIALCDALVALYRVCPVRIRTEAEEQRRIEHQKLITWEVA